MSWDTKLLNEQLYGIQCAIATGSFKNKVMSHSKIDTRHGAKLYRDLAREHVGASKVGTQALGLRITKPKQAEMKDLEQRLLDWDSDVATFFRITGAQPKELRVTYLQDMLPPEVTAKYESEKHRLSTYEDFRAFLSCVIADWKNGRSTGRRPEKHLKELEAEKQFEEAGEIFP